MKISAKGRYALAAMTNLAQNYLAETPITIASLADKLGISKIYLEQVFSLLKRSGLVTSVKGAHGGYQLAAEPGQIDAYQILTATELALIEKTENTVLKKDPAIEQALYACVFAVIDEALKERLAQVTLADIAHEAAARSAGSGSMYFI